MPARPRLSVVIPTHNRPDLVRRLVRNLWEIGLEEFDLGPEGLEVIVVDDSSTPPLELEDKRCRTVRLDTSSGQSRARNAGAREARGRLIAFADDDTILLPGGWGALLSILERDEAAWVGPKVIPPSWEPAHGNNVLTVDALGTQFIATRRDRFEAVGQFNEGVQALMDFDISLRARQAGDRLLMYTGAVLVHDDQRATFRLGAVRFHDWISETPQIWARTGGASRDLTAWETNAYCAALYPRHRAAGFAARILQPEPIWRAFVRFLPREPRPRIVGRALGALARYRGARIGLRAVSSEEQRALRAACREARGRGEPDRVISSVPFDGATEQPDSS